MLCFTSCYQGNDGVGWTVRLPSGFYFLLPHHGLETTGASDRAREMGISIVPSAQLYIYLKLVWFCHSSWNF